MVLLVLVLGGTVVVLQSAWDKRDLCMLLLLSVVWALGCVRSEKSTKNRTYV